MAHITSLGAGVFSDLSICRETYTTVPADSSAWMLNFATELASGAAVTNTSGEFTRITDVREFPSMGTPPNIVNVPTYGQKTSKQIQGQSDAPNMEITLNFVPSVWQNTANYLGKLVGDGNQYYFRFTLMNSEPTGSGDTKYASTVSGVGTVGNSQWFWIGKLEALLVNPQLTDANTATLTISIQSAFYGAYTS